MRLLIFFATSLFVGCSTTSYYSLNIISMDDGGKETATTKVIEAENDTIAFKKAVQEYWVAKGSVLEVNKKLATSMPIPFHFDVKREDGSYVKFDKAVEERLAEPVTSYYKEQVLPRIDSMKKRDQPTSNIY